MKKLERNPKIALQSNFSFQFLTPLPSKPFSRLGKQATKKSKDFWYSPITLLNEWVNY